MPVLERRETIGIPPNHREIWRRETSGVVTEIVGNQDMSFEPWAIGRRRIRLSGSMLNIMTDSGEEEKVLFPKVFTLPERKLLEGAEVKWDYVTLHVNDIEGITPRKHYRLTTGDESSGWTIQVDIEEWDGNIKVRETSTVETTDIPV